MAAKGLPRTIWMLGFVSLFMDVSSELVHSLLPVFVTATLGASVAELGLLEGGAEAVALIVKVFSGTLSDKWRARKSLALVGYGLAAVTKPLFPLAQSIGVVFAARYIDRIGKGIRGAPRDALIADVAPPDQRGQAFGLRQTLDTIGAFLGPCAAILLMLLSGGNIHFALWFAVVPAFLCVAFLFFGVKEPEQKSAPEASKKITLAAFRDLRRPFWIVVGLGAILTLARFSEAFLILRAQKAGMEATWVPLVMIAMNIVYALSAYPVGLLSDRMDRRALLIPGVAFLIAADLCLAFAGGIAGVMAGVVLWGLHMGFTQGLLATLVADETPEALRGTGFGVFNFASGIVLFAASALAGALWDWGGAQATFAFGAAVSTVALIGLCVYLRLGHRNKLGLV